MLLKVHLVGRCFLDIHFFGKAFNDKVRKTEIGKPNI